jgi:hypothetical protein
VAAGKAVYKYSGAQDVVSCVTHPHLASCIKAAVTIVLVVATAGEGEVGVAALDAAEEAGAGVAKRAGVKAAESCGLSFAANTKVLMASGKAVPISSLKPGQVASTSTRTGKTQAGAIAAVLVHHDTNLYDLTVRARGRTAVIHTTSNRPFWDATAHRWVKAGALRYGTRLRTPAAGTATALGGHTPRDRSGWMWDLTIPGNHDFYVSAAGTAVLVHNCSVRMTQRQADTLSVGPHAGEPVPATGPVVTPEQSEAMQGLPCHTCGETAPRMIGGPSGGYRAQSRRSGTGSISPVSGVQCRPVEGRAERPADSAQSWNL